LEERNLVHEETLKSISDECKNIAKLLSEQQDKVLKEGTEEDALRLKFMPNTLLQEFRSEVQDWEGKTESLAQEFLDGRKPLDSFLKEFKESRYNYHLRAVKYERYEYFTTCEQNT
jgi:hypothetical protein